METRKDGHQKAQPSDASVIATNDDAFMCKYAAVKRQYFADDFLVAIVESSGLISNLTALRRPPIINRGTFARVEVVRRIVEEFLRDESHENHTQIVSLGAGYDTLPFRLMEKEQKVSVSFIELDFPSVTQSKSEIVKNVRRITSLFDTLTSLQDGCGVTGVKSRATPGNMSKYILYPCDLRHIAALDAAFEACDVDFSLPTLFLTECVLMYMDPTHSDALLSYAASRFSGPRCFVNYEPINPTDPFGQQMVANIALRGSPLLGIDAYPDERAQKRRFEKTGWLCADAVNMLQAFDAMFTYQEKMALNRCEPLDEVEEWNLIMSHYVIVFARSCTNLSKHFIFDWSTGT